VITPEKQEIEKIFERSALWHKRRPHSLLPLEAAVSLTGCPNRI
jgi:hypothetical protein